jgi:hypothetical protein
MTKEENQPKQMILQDIKDFAEREKTLAEYSARKEEVPIKVEFTEDEIHDKSEASIVLAIAIEKEKIRKKEFMDEWNEIVKPKESDQRLLLKEIDAGFKYVDMMLYAVQDFDTRTMNYYDPEGFLRLSRKLLPDEFQKMIK